MNDSVSSGDAGALLISELVRAFGSAKELAERALAQLDDEQWYEALDPLSNPPSVMVRHVAGNLRSRWREFLTTDGEKSDRDRDGEFTPSRHSVAEMMREWEQGFATVFDTLAGLKPTDLSRTVTINGKSLLALTAMLNSYGHTSQHVGQIVMLAKHLRGGEWETLSIPRAKPGR